MALRSFLETVDRFALPTIATLAFFEPKTSRGLPIKYNGPIRPFVSILYKIRMKITLRLKYRLSQIRTALNALRGLPQTSTICPLEVLEVMSGAVAIRGRSRLET